VIIDKINGNIGLIFLQKLFVISTISKAFEAKNVRTTMIILQIIQAIKAQALFISMLEKG
jgi:hypothetical protein